MTTALLDTPARRGPYGFWGSTLWTIAAFIAGIVATFVFLGIQAVATGNPNNLSTVEYLEVLTCLVIIAVIIWAVRRTGWPLKDYLAFVMPSKLHIAVAIIGTVGIALSENSLVSLLGGHNADRGTLLAAYSEAQRAGLLPLYWLNTVGLAPLTEEIVFRGFLLPSWSRALGWPAGIVGTSILFAMMHIQYDWQGIIAVGLLGIFCAWLRLRSCSLVPPIVAHVAANLLATIGVALTL
jgi:membrane protease YdiL (CAAX protease family)